MKTTQTKLTASTITNKQIEALKDEAGVAGDFRMVEICQDALNCTGERCRSARQACAVAINEVVS